MKDRAQGMWVGVQYHSNMPFMDWTIAVPMVSSFLMGSHTILAMGFAVLHPLHFNYLDHPQLLEKITIGSF